MNNYGKFITLKAITKLIIAGMIFNIISHHLYAKLVILTKIIKVYLVSVSYPARATPSPPAPPITHIWSSKGPPTRAL